MKKILSFFRSFDFIVVVVCCIFFILPFFWFKQGTVDFGGDGGRLYFLAPFKIATIDLHLKRPADVFSFANIPYLYVFSLIRSIVQSPTNAIAFEHGLQISLSFGAMYLLVKKLLEGEDRINSVRKSIISSIAAGFYLTLITKTGWVASMVTLNQIFLNTLVFYLLLEFLLKKRYIFFFLIIVITLIFSANFGLTSSPQLFSFFPLSLIFLTLYIYLIRKVSIPWVSIFLLFWTFVGIHSFHILPVMATLFTKDSWVNTNVFDAQAVQNRAGDYFFANHLQLGKLSSALFLGWIKERLLMTIFPLITLLGVISRPTKLLYLVFIFFLITLFLVTANITNFGVMLYGLLFRIPGFVLFRGFDEKWHYIFSFFYSLTFGISLYQLLRICNQKIVKSVLILLICILLYILKPLFSGVLVHSTIRPSFNVPTVYEMDENFIETVHYIDSLPVTGKVLTLPLTFTYFQIVHGKGTGAYLGISLIASLTNKQDIAGLWQLSTLRNSFLSAVRKGDSKKITQVLSLLNVKYIFYNADNRNMTEIPAFFDPDGNRKTSEIPDIMTSNLGYEQLLDSLPVEKIFQNGFYSIYEFAPDITRPTIYIPSEIYLNEKMADFDSSTSAFVDKSTCNVISCSQIKKIPLQYSIKHTSLYELKFGDLTDVDPFLIVLSTAYDKAWDMTLADSSEAIYAHIKVNGDSNGWIINPLKLKNKKDIHGKIMLTYQRQFHTGLVITGVTCIFILGWIIYKKRVTNEK